MTPTRISRGAACATSKENTCTINVVPTFAPSITARPGARSTRLPAAKPVSIRPVAVLLCSTAVTPRPAPKALKRFDRAEPKAVRNFGPKARCTPVWTMWTPQSSSAMLPARLRTVSDRPISAQSIS